MPTVKKRHAITETDAVKNALGVAAERWPDLKDKPTALLNALIEFGSRTLIDDHEERLQGIKASAGALPGVFTADALAQLREDWPG